MQRTGRPGAGLALLFVLLNSSTIAAGAAESSASPGVAASQAAGSSVIPRGRTALIQSVFKAEDDEVRALLASGEAVNARDDDGVSALQMAAHVARPTLVKLLLDTGADANASNNAQSTVLASYIVDPERATAKAGQLASIRLLLDRGARVDGGGAGGLSPLMLAASRDLVDVVGLLLERGAAVDALGGQAPGRGGTALYAACEAGATESAILLLKAGASPARIMADGRTPLMAALESRSDETATLLIEKSPRAAINAVSAISYYPHGPNTRTALGIAVAHGESAWVDRLIARGADVNLPADSEGRVPITLAVQQGRTDLLSLLLKHGARTELRDRQGRTVLMSVASLGPNAEALRLLLAAGARVDAKDKLGRTVLDVALSSDAHAENEAVLRAAGARSSGLPSGCCGR